MHFAFKYGGDFEACLLANTNTGGENVARGMVLGALLGAVHGVQGIPAHLKEGLKDSEGIAKDIEAFVAQLQPPPGAQKL
mmetsp:Transcript_50292/g.150209  ORF Transcript_50292/g.150209 Transcript_50292/m.150209 type:complete len:80 (+) Transcript_50292:929-1168(+)